MDKQMQNMESSTHKSIGVTAGSLNERMQEVESKINDIIKNIETMVDPKIQQIESMRQKMQIKMDERETKFRETSKQWEDHWRKECTKWKSRWTKTRRRVTTSSQWEFLGRKIDQMDKSIAVMRGSLNERKCKK